MIHREERQVEEQSNDGLCCLAACGTVMSGGAEMAARSAAVPLF
jgi:hypothetical protein